MGVFRARQKMSVCRGRPVVQSAPLPPTLCYLFLQQGTDIFLESQLVDLMDVRKFGIKLYLCLSSVVVLVVVVAVSSLSSSSSSSSSA